MRKIILLFSGLLLLCWGNSVKAQYCTPTYATGCTSGDDIDDFSMIGAGINHSASGCSLNGYGDFTANASLEGNMQITETYSFSTTHNFGSQYVSIWIDFDNSGTFDPSELLFTSTNGANATNGSITIPGTATPSTTVMRVVDNYGSAPNDACNPGSSWGETHDYTVNILPAPTCPSPSNLQVSNITGTSADLNWTIGGAETNWNIEYVPAGAAQGTGTVVAANTNPFTLTGLASATSYDIYLQADCGGGDVSSWIGVQNVTTLLAPLSCSSGSPYVLNQYDFESGIPSALSQSASSNPQWTAGTGSTVSGSTGPSGAYTGNGYIFLETSGGTTGSQDILTSQPIDLTAITAEARMYFYYHMYGATTGSIEVEVSDDGGATWNSEFLQVGEVQTSETDPWLSANIDLTPYTGSVIQYRIIGERGTSFTGDIAIDLLTIEICTTCPPVSDFMAISSTQNSIDLQWTPNGTETSWNIEYGPSGFTPGSGTTVVAGTNSFTVTGLNDNTEYDFYIEADCGAEQSLLVGPVSYSTQCIPTAAPYSEDFNANPWITGTGNDNSFSSIDNCWFRSPESSTDFFWGTRLGPTSSANTGPSGDHPIGNGNYIYTEASNGAIGDWASISSLPIDISGLANPVVEFYYHLYGADIDTFFVDVNDGSTWTTVDTIVGQQQAGNNSAWEYRMVNVSAVAVGATNFTFRFRAKKGGENSDYAIDNVAVIEEPSCLPPSDLTVVDSTSNSIELSWTNGDTETNWNIEYGPAGYTPGTGTLIVANSNPFNVTGLNGNTEYDFYVQADCGGGDVSIWSPGASGTTLCASEVVPYLESFTAGAIPGCWNTFSVDGSTSANASWKFTGGAGYGATGNGGKPNGTFAWVDGSTPSTSQAVLESNTIDLTGLTTPTLSFELFSNNTDNPGDNMVFTVDINDGTTVNNLFTFAGDSSEWMLYQFDLSAYAGQTVQFIFTVDQTTTTSSAFYNDILLDEVAVCEAEDASFTYSNTDLCNLSSTLVSPNITGLAGGTFEAPVGLDINATTGDIDPSNSTLGVYEVTYTSSNSACRTTETFTVEVIDVEDPTFDYPVVETCQLDDNLIPNVQGTTGGVFTASPSINIDQNTGEINTSNAAAGLYTVTYTTSSSACSASDVYSFEVIENEDASFTYDENFFCLNYTEIVPTINGVQGGTFSTNGSVAVNPVTGKIGAEASNPGTYWVYYTTPGQDCPSTDSVQIEIGECLGIDENAMQSISLYPNPANDVISVVVPEMNGNINMTIMDASGKTVYDTNIDGKVGQKEINVAPYENGVYTVHFKNESYLTTKRVVISR